ncbi:MAG: radical SAM protein [Hyphomicrobiales bacterium]|nr:radical SAM protein [Hyphomicrobiales bacterium]MCP5373344.1 radical SAM protein [Hyphomicrobiales bacterium]
MMLYDMPLYRPPSEGQNLIIQATLGCSFNGCTFCSMYKSKQFLARPLDVLFADIEDAARDWPDAHRVFLADGDALVLPTDTLMAILDRLRANLPDLARVSCYATPTNLLRKSVDELRALRDAGLRLVYVGIESGSGDILRRIRKGATEKSMVQALSRAAEAGLKVSATVVLGLGGRDRWREHIEGTARVVNAAPPTYLSTLQLHLEPDAVDEFLAKYGAPFAAQDDAGVLEELRLLLSLLDPPRPVIFRSNHASNCLPLAGNLPRDRDRLVALVDMAQRGAAPLRPRWIRGL